MICLDTSSYGTAMFFLGLLAALAIILAFICAILGGKLGALQERYDNLYRVHFRSAGSEPEPAKVGLGLSSTKAPAK